jgi:cytochrome b561
MRPAAPRLALAGRWELAAKLMHGALWFLLLALPVTALLTLGSESHPLTLWGGVRVERLPFAGVGAVKWIDWGEVHEFLAVAMMWFAGLHAVAALFHHLVLKDGLLASMWPRARSG